MTSTLRVLCVDLESEPLFTKSAPGRPRVGYEPSVAAALGEELGREVVWEPRQWAEMIPSLLRGEADCILCGQGIIPEREELVNFTKPYAVFDESVVVRSDSPVASAHDLVGKRVLAIAGSTNERLARSFPGAEVVPFHGQTDDVLGDLVAQVLEGAVDALVDDEVVLIPLLERMPLRIAFTERTSNPWGIAVRPGNDQLLSELDAALERLVASGRLRSIWDSWMPQLSYPFPKDAE